MKDRLVTPTCEITGLPLPIRQTEPQNGAQFSFYDYHHHFHPRRAEELQSLGGAALRISRGQFMPRALHDRYHRQFTGPELASTTPEQYRLCVLACAGVVPRQVIDVSGKNDFAVVSLNNQEHDSLANAKLIYPERADKPQRYTYTKAIVGKFFAAYALQQNISEVLSEKVIGEFLDENTKSQRKKELGNFILREALDMSLDTVIPVHNEARKEGLVPATAKHRRVTKVVKSFFPPRYFADYYQEMGRILAPS